LLPLKKENLSKVTPFPVVKIISITLNALINVTGSNGAMCRQINLLFSASEIISKGYYAFFQYAESYFFKERIISRDCWDDKQGVALQVMFATL